MLTVGTLTGLATGSLIQVRAAAHNADGWGADSAMNSAGAVLETQPLAVGALALDGAPATPTSAKIDWAAPTGAAAGGAGVAITGYTVQRALVGGSFATVDSPSLPTHTATGLAEGTAYKYRVAASNAYGAGPYSAELAVGTACSPGLYVLSHGDGTSSCETCPVDFTCDGSSAKTACPAGSFAAAGATACA